MEIKKDIKLLVFRDDNDAVKDKDVIILEENEYGIKIQFYDIEKKEEYGVAFFLPWHRVLKIKEKEISPGNDGVAK